MNHTHAKITAAVLAAAMTLSSLPTVLPQAVAADTAEVVYATDFEDGDVSDWTDYYGMVAAAEAGTYTNGYTNAYSSDKANNGAGNFVSCGTKPHFQILHPMYLHIRGSSRNVISI